MRAEENGSDEERRDFYDALSANIMNDWFGLDMDVQAPEKAHGKDARHRAQLSADIESSA